MVPDVNEPVASRVAMWEVEFAALEEEWRAIMFVDPRVSADVDAWEVEFSAMEKEYHEVATQRRWATGPADLLTVVGSHRNELTHSRMIQWLLDPTGRHGLDRSVLDGMLALVWPDLPIPKGWVFVDREVDRESPGPDGQPVQARADIVVRAGTAVIVIENKMDAAEGPRQCWRLHEVWKGADAGADVRWVLLSPRGSPPTTAGDSLSDWRSMSYRQLRSLIAVAVAATAREAGAGDPFPIGRATVDEYLTTLDSINQPFENLAPASAGGQLHG